MEPSGVAIPHRITALLLACAFALGACGTSGGPAASGPSSPSATAPATSRPATPRPSSTARPTSAPAVAPGPLRLVGAGPVIERNFIVDRGAMLPGAVVEADGTFHAWVIAFGSTPGVQDIHHLTSPDAIAWTDVPEASLEALSNGLGNPGALPTTVLRDGDTWRMFMTGTLASEREGWDIWAATAPSLDGPWTRSATPVLRRGPAGAWDSGGLDFPTVLRAGDGFVLAYSGIDLAHRDGGSIGLATSTDGIEWLKLDDPATTDGLFGASDPVAEPGLCGGFDDRAIYQPRIIDAGDRWVMAYAGYVGPPDAKATVGLATSSDDGATWGCLGPGIDTSGMRDGFVHTLTAFERGGRMALLVEWFRDAGTDIWLLQGNAP